MNKYHNRKVLIDGKVFASKKEGNFYLYLKSLLQKGEIKELICQAVIKYPDGTKFIPDFKVTFSNGEEVYYEVKSPATRTQTYRLKKRLLFYFFPKTNFQEV